MDLQKRIKNKFRRTLVDTLSFFNLESLIIRGKKTNEIVMYHGIDLLEDKKFNSRFIGYSNFKKQIEFLKKHTNIISLQDFFEKKFDPSKSNIAITFDDGFLNNYKYAFPFLESMKVPATIYVTGLNQTEYDILWPDFTDIASYFTSKPIVIEDIQYVRNENGKYFSKELNLQLNIVIKQKGNFDFKKEVFTAFDLPEVNFKQNEAYFDYWKLMNDEQLQEVDRSKYVKIESHAYWHNNLGNITLEEAKKELIDSKNYLENLLQREINELAYPDSSYTRELISAAESIGFKYQLAADGYTFDEDKNDPRILDRVGLYPIVSWSNQLFDLNHKK